LETTDTAKHRPTEYRACSLLYLGTSESVQVSPQPSLSVFSA